MGATRCRVCGSTAAASLPEALAYGASLALWQRRLAEQADAAIVPSAFARERLRRSPHRCRGTAYTCCHRPCARFASVPPRESGSYALVVSRLAPEKGVDVAIEACRLAGLPLVVAGEGPSGRAAGACRRADVRFVGPCR